MKKRLILIAIATLLVVGLAACDTTKPSEDISDNEGHTEIVNGEENHKEEDTKEKEPVEYEFTEDGIIKPAFAEEIIEEVSYEVIYAIKEKDARTIAEHIHPEKGVRFTPYTHVSLEDDIVLNREEMKRFFEEKEVYLWGHYDGKGHEISLTPSEYYKEFIYTEDFVEAEEIGYNEVLSSGNMLENQFEVYEQPIVVEYYFSGFNPDYVGMDWRSLRLVFEEYEGDWKLVGIIHNQWTI